MKEGMKINSPAYLLIISFIFFSKSLLFCEDINYVQSRLHFGRFYYLDEQLEKFPVELNEAELDIIYRAQEEFDKMTKDNELLAIKTVEIGLLNVFQFAEAAKAPEMFLSRSWYLEKELGLDVILKYINDEKVITLDKEIAVDFHLHTIYSYDSVSDIESLLKKADEKGLGAIAVTDHNHLDGIKEVVEIAQRLKTAGEIYPDFIIIPGEEISTLEGGHIGALFINSYIVQGMTSEETIREIHSQGGLAIAMHPGGNEELGIKLTESLDFDAVEVGNGSDFLPNDFYRNLILENSPELGQKAKFFGGNAHMSQGVGWLGYTIVQVEEKTQEGIKKAVKEGKTKPVFISLYRPYRKFFKNESVNFLYSVLNTYDSLKRDVELFIGRIIVSKDFRIESTWDESLHDVFNLVGIYRYYKDEDNSLRKPVKLARISVTYGMVNLEYDFLKEQTNCLIKFMF